MNEPIKELMLEAGFPEWSHSVVGAELEKFAELIVKECIQFCGHPDGIRVKAMKSHFGVE